MSEIDANSTSDDMAITPSEDMLELKKPKERIRFEWLDQFRGLVVLLFIISIVTWKLSDDLVSPEFALAPANLDHGWRFYDYYYDQEGNKFDPVIITIIDIGQEIFMFLVGFMQAFSYTKRKIKYDVKDARRHVFKRYLWIMVFSFLYIIVKGKDLSKPNEWFREFFFNGTLANIAWGGLLAGIICMITDNGDKRFMIGFGILVLHAILYPITALREAGNDYFKFQWNVLGHIGIAIIAAAYTDWFFTKKMAVNEDNLVERVLPVSAAMIVVYAMVDWVQWSQHHNVTMALAALSIGTSGFMIWIFYMFDKVGFQLPGLTAFGKNMFALFILSGAVIELGYWPAMEDFIETNRLTALIFGAVVPILIMWFLAKLMERKNIYFKV